MNYPTRITVALGAASCIVAGSIASTPRVLGALDFGAIVVPEPRPIQLDLRDLQPLPPEPEEKKDPPQRLIDAGAPAEAPVRETDLISSQDSQAQDQSDKEGDDARPAADQIDEFDQVGAAPSAPAPPPTPPQAAAPPAQEPPPVEPATETSQEPTPPVAETPSGPAPETQTARVAVANLPKDEPRAPSEKPADAKSSVQEPTPEPKPEGEIVENKSETTQPPERFQVAAAPQQEPQAPAPPAPAAPQVPVQELRAEKGREGGGATNSGFTSFEANKHALGEYMLKVRNAVEREWRTALHLRYSGVSRTDATIRCSIRPDGSLEFVTITNAGSSLTYAVLCREAIEKAGPFEPFPFDVPEIYRNQNLEINWKFSYM